MREQISLLQLTYCWKASCYFGASNHLKLLEKKSFKIIHDFLVLNFQVTTLKALIIFMGYCSLNQTLLYLIAFSIKHLNEILQTFMSLIWSTLCEQILFFQSPHKAIEQYVPKILFLPNLVVSQHLNPHFQESEPKNLGISAFCLIVLSLHILLLVI